MQQINSVAIIGAGVQGAMLAYRNAAYGLPTFVYDNVPGFEQRLIAQCREWFPLCAGKPWQRQASIEAVLENLHCAATLAEAVAEADLVIENVPENLPLKQQVWQDIDAITQGKALLTTNSSSLRCSDININTIHKEKTLNLNFTFPVRDDMVEAMWNEATDKQSKEAILDYLRRLGHIAIVTEHEIKGFSMNRVWRAMKKEALFLWSHGYNTPENIDRAFMLEWGTKIGPFGRMDRVGLDTVYKIEMSYYGESQDPSDMPPSELKELIDRGMLGEKSGQGFYSWPDPVFMDEDWLKG